MTGRAVKGAAKIVAAVAVAGGLLALTWTPIIRPVLMSKTVGPEDRTGYVAKMKPTEGAGDARFPSGKWVRRDGGAVLWIDSAQKQDVFSFELHAEPTPEETAAGTAAADTAAEAVIQPEKPTDERYQAHAACTQQDALLSLDALKQEEAIEVTASDAWKAAHPKETSVDGTYYRIRHTWFWVNEESGRWGMTFIPGEEATPEPTVSPSGEKPEIETKTETVEPTPGWTERGIPVVRVAPPPVSDKTPRRVVGGGEYLSLEQMRTLYEQGFFVHFSGAYLVASADVTDDLRFFTYHYEESKQPDKAFCVGTEEGLRCAEMRLETLTQAINSIYGTTDWMFATKVDFMPEFSSLQVDQGGRFVRQVELSQGKVEVGYEVNSFSWTNRTDNSWYKTDWSSKEPEVIRVSGGVKIDQAAASRTNVADQLEYNLNLYFRTDGTAEAEGFLTLVGLGTEKIVYWIQMVADDFQVDYAYRDQFSFTSAAYRYSFETLDDDVPEFDAEREDVYAADTGNASFRRYEYEHAYQSVEQGGEAP